ncbi:MAG TPA: SRPBCC family protein [Aquabacterium sp.]|uniref:SRPBCC family protein n=1 Tax=Aquabacterium sp. TaxID=1872578 RepID=UPI002E33F2F1|nr:SRPBCC family protein [Aquabacterium sp.]HEX5356190.1 SRPBCC family protein [Aquabacterium sp.]
MKQILMIGGLALLAATALLLAYASTRPDEFRVERKLRIAASSDKLWPLIGELRAFNRWNPYERKDPAIKGRYSGAATGPGSRYEWESDKVGVGSLEITGQQPGQAVQMRLDFVKPFEAHNQAEFRLVPQGDGSTDVIWSMQGPANLISKVMGVFINMDKMVGRDFEDGLVNLQHIAKE